MAELQFVGQNHGVGCCFLPLWEVWETIVWLHVDRQEYYLKYLTCTYKLDLLYIYEPQLPPVHLKALPNEMWTVLYSYCFRLLGSVVSVLWMYFSKCRSACVKCWEGRGCSRNAHTVPLNCLIRNKTNSKLQHSSVAHEFNQPNQSCCQTSRISK